MVRSKPFTAALGRKQRIEGIVKNLSDKILTHDQRALNNSDSQVSSPAESFSHCQRQTDPHWTTTTSVNRPSDLVYHLPQGLEFSGIVSSQPLLKGRRFGPFFGKITPFTEQYTLDHTFVCQIPDLDGNPYSLHLQTDTMKSCMWVKCLQRCSLQGVYNIVTYNTPTGVVFEVVTEAGRGTELCVAYDQSYDVAEGSVVANEVIEIPSREPTPEKQIALIEENSREPVEENVLNPRDDFPLPSDPNNNNKSASDAVQLKNKNETTTPSAESPYSVMTAEVTEEFHPVTVKNENKKPVVTKEKKVVKPTRSNLTKLKGNEKELKEKDKKSSFRAYRCHSCKCQFNSYEEKQHHLETEHSRECPVCNKSYSRSYLKEHMLYHLEAARLTCSICSKVFSSMSNLRKHQKKHSRRTCARKQIISHQCSECPQKYKSQKQLEVHRKKHVKVVPISCSECNETFTHKNILRRHQALVHRGKKPYSCKICQKTFTQSGNVARHVRQVHSAVQAMRDEEKKKRYFCRRRGCDQKSFASRDLFIKHLEQHSGSGGIYPCKECSGVFSSASNLCKHKKTQHSKKVVTTTINKKLSCHLCKQSFQSENLYHKHVRSHKINKSENKCDDCGKVFANRSGLFKHIRLRRCPAIKERKTIKPQRNYECSVCSKSFFTMSELRIHRRSHLLENRHVCDVCGKSFSQRGNLGKHKRHVHEGIPRPPDKPREKKLTCETCDKSFKTVAAVEAHKRMHVVKKPLKCGYCERRFSNMGGRKKHMMACKRPRHSANMSRVFRRISSPTISKSKDEKPLANGDEEPDLKTILAPASTEQSPAPDKQPPANSGPSPTVVEPSLTGAEPRSPASEPASPGPGLAPPNVELSPEFSLEHRAIYEDKSLSLLTISNNPPVIKAENVESTERFPNFPDQVTDTIGIPDTYDDYIGDRFLGGNEDEFAEPGSPVF